MLRVSREQKKSWRRKLHRTSHESRKHCRRLPRHSPEALRPAMELYLTSRAEPVRPAAVTGRWAEIKAGWRISFPARARRTNDTHTSSHFEYDTLSISTVYDWKIKIYFISVSKTIFFIIQASQDEHNFFFFLISHHAPTHGREDSATLWHYLTHTHTTQDIAHQRNVFYSAIQFS